MKEMRKRVDFLFRYEHKVRELESIMLLRMELEKRGYTVAFTANYDENEKVHYNPRVIVSPAIYWDGTLKSDLMVYGLKKKVANMLWEQVMGIEEEDSPTGPHNVTGTGQKIIAFCWGKRIQDRLVAAGMPIENARVVGQINTDLLRVPFVSILKTKKQLSEEYDLDINARWNLFISSFAYCELDDLQKSLVLDVYGEKYLREFTESSNESRKMILEWFEKALIKYPHDIIIYRPHPDEAKKSKILKVMEQKYPNFRVISDYALKHWIHASDKIYNWYSTGIIDAVILNKPNRLLRPCKVPLEYDYRLFCKADQIQSLDDFVDDYASVEVKQIFDPGLFSEYYFLPTKSVYVEICDILEEMLTTSKYDIIYSIRERIHFGTAFIKYHLIKRLGSIKPLLRKLHLFKGMLEKSEIRRKAFEEGYEKNVATEKEIEALRELYTPIIYGE